PDEFKHSVAQCIQQRRLLDENDELKNMLSLFRSSQAIAGCLDSEHLYHLLVEAIARETGLSSALGFFIVEGTLDLKIAKGVSAELGKSLLEVISSRLSSPVAEEYSIQHLELSPQFCPEGFTDAFLIPVANHLDTFG